jgi:hypothetical protein
VGKTWTELRWMLKPLWVFFLTKCGKIGEFWRELEKTKKISLVSAFLLKSFRNGDQLKFRLEIEISIRDFVR